MGYSVSQISDFKRNQNVGELVNELNISSGSHSDYLKLSPNGADLVVERSDYPSLANAIGTSQDDTFVAELEQEINNPSPVATDYFGSAVIVSSDGSRLIIGAYLEDTGASAAGSVYIYSRSGTTWGLEQEILNPSPVISAFFGRRVSINSDGSRVIIGAERDDVTAIDAAGSVFVYSRSGTTWTLEQEINNPTPVTIDWFGYSVDINSDGSRIIVGAEREDTGASAAGSVYVYLRSGTTWTLEQEINNPTPVASDYFGTSVSIDSDGNRVIIGARLEDTGASAAGSVYVYSRSGTTWSLEQEINNPTPVASDEFGHSVNIDSSGSRVIIGTPYEDTGADAAGSVYVYSRSGTTWTLEQEINNPSAVIDDWFGYSVDINSDGLKIIVSAYLEDTGADAAGSVYVYSRSGSTWSLEQEINNPSPVASDYFGTSVSINGDGTLVSIGAEREDTGADAAGSAYVYSLSYLSNITPATQIRLVGTDKYTHIKIK